MIRPNHTLFHISCLTVAALLPASLHAQVPAPTAAAPVFRPPVITQGGQVLPSPGPLPADAPPDPAQFVQPSAPNSGAGSADTYPPATPPPLIQPAPAAPVAAPGNAIDELGVELNRRRQAEELSANGDPNTPRTFRNQGQVPLRTLFLSLAKQAQIPYFEPPFPDDPSVAFYAPEGIKPLDAFYAAADAYGYKVITKPNGFITLSRRDIKIPEGYTRHIYHMQHLNPFFALQPLAQSLGFQVKSPGQNSPSFPAPNTSGGGGGGGLGGSTSSDDQSTPRFTPILPLDAPIYFRQKTGTASGAETQESYLFVDRKQKAFVLYGSDSEHQQIRDYLQGLDQPEKLIKVHTEIYRVSRTRNDSVGIDWTNTFSGATFSLNPSMASAGGFSFLPTGLLLSYPNVSATVRFLVQKGIFRNVATTDFLLRDGIPNTIRQITEDPVVLSTGLTGSTTVNTGTGGGTSGNTGASASGTTEVKTFYYGLSIDGVAFAMPGGKIDLNLNLALSQNTGDKQTSQGPIPKVQRNTTPVSAVVRPGTTCAFGGLVSGNEQISRAAIPYLSKIPFLGRLFFASTVKTFSGDTLIVFTTPFIIDPDEDVPNPLAANERLAKTRLEANIDGFEGSTELRRARTVPDGKEFSRFRTPVTRPPRSIMDDDMQR